MKSLKKIFLTIVFCLLSVSFLPKMNVIAKALSNLNLPITSEETDIYKNKKNDLNVASETSSGQEITNLNYDSSEFNMHNSLYKVLIKLARELYSNNTNSFNTDIFNYSLSYSSYKPTLTSNGRDGEKIVEDLRNGELNLSVGENAKYNCLKNVTKISDISGLNALNLTSIKKLYLDNNNISEINEFDLDSLNNLNFLSVKNNALKTFKMNENIVTLNELNLSNNFLRNVDLSKLVIKNNENPSVNLSKNRLSLLESINYPTCKLLKLDLSFNYLGLLSEEKLNNLKAHLVDEASIRLLVQGVKDESIFYKNDSDMQGLSDLNKLKAGEELIIYQDSEIENLNVAFLYSSSSSFYSSNDIICKTSGQKEIDKINVPAGKVRIEFYSANFLISKENFSSLDNDLLNLLSSKDLNVAISNPAYRAVNGAGEPSSLNESTDIKIEIYVANLEKIPNREDILKENGGAEYFYNVGGSNPLNSKNLEITRNGKFNYSCYVVFDGIKSNELALNISRQDMSGVTWGIIIIVIIFVISASVYYILKWFKAGGVVAPLSSKEIYHYNKKMAKKSEMNEDFVSNLNASDHEKQNPKDTDDFILEDLNSNENDKFDN